MTILLSSDVELIMEFNLFTVIENITPYFIYIHEEIKKNINNEIIEKKIFLTSCFCNLCKIFEPLDLLKGLQITISLKTVPENTTIFSLSSPNDVAEYLIFFMNRIIKH